MLKIERIKISDIKPYSRNAKLHPQSQINQIKKSILEFGFNDPVAVDENNELIEGHGRLTALKQLKYTEVDAIRIVGLTEEQKKAYKLVHNKLTMNTDFDINLLEQELEDICTIDMSEFDLKLIDEEIKSQQTDWQDQTQFRRANIENLEYAQYDAENKYDIPELDPVYELPPIKEWIRFDQVLTDKNPEGKAVHFFLDDYKFERIWNSPDKYINKLRQYVCVASPDFSLFGDMPLALQIYAHYRKHWVAKYWQENGITVIPTIRSSTDPRSLEWYLDGEPRNSIVMLSGMWENYDENSDMNKQEFERLKQVLNPKKIFIYGASDNNELYKGENIEFIDNYMITMGKKGQEKWQKEAEQAIEIQQAKD